MKLLRAMKKAIFPIWFPFFSVFSKRFGITILVPTFNGWFAHTRGKFFPIKSLNIESLEYYRYFMPKTGGVVFDVGGELGFETAQFSMIVGRAGKVYVFECFPAHVKHLKDMSKVSENIIVVEKACWNSKKEMIFYQGNTPGSNTALPEARGQAGQKLASDNMCKLTVQADTLDSLWSELTNRTEVDFLKMDIEGAEIEALEGARELLLATQKVVIAAYHVREGAPTAEKVSRILSLAGFKVSIDENLHVYGFR